MTAEEGSGSLVLVKEVRAEIRGRDEAGRLSKDGLQSALIQFVMQRNQKSFAGSGGCQPPEFDVAALLALDRKPKAAKNGKHFCAGKDSETAHQAAVASSRVARTMG